VEAGHPDGVGRSGLRRAADEGPVSIWHLYSRPAAHQSSLCGLHHGTRLLQPWRGWLHGYSRGTDVRLERTAQDLVRCVPPPDWIDHQPYQSDIPGTEVSCVASGLCRLLYDSQLDLRNSEQAWHHRTVQRVLTREGAERAAHVVVEFDPGYQRIEVHFVRVLRGAEVIEHAKADAFQLLRRETNLERLVFDGRLTASLLIPDVRIGDIVDLAVSVYGSVPVLKRRHAAWVVFDSFNPWFEHRHRLLRPLDRNIVAKAYNDPPEPVAAIAGQTEDVRWQVTGQERRPIEGLTPSWVLLRPTLQFSEFDSWNDVTTLLAPYYEGGELPRALAEEVDRLAAAYSQPDQRAVEWLRFLQRELRYFAFSLGEGGLTPRTLDTIWSTRFGDCKDAATLYVAGARRMGLDACAALVSTTHGNSLNRFLPSSAVFDHCIVRVRLDDRSYWLDPTASVQSGSLRHVFQPHIGWGLVLSQETVGLEELGGGAALHILHWEDDVTVGPKVTSPAIVRRKIDYSFWAADAIRSRFANDGPSVFAQAMLRELQNVWPGAAETAPMEIQDDKDRNTITLSLNYEVRDCWKSADDESQLKLVVARALSGELQPLPGERRETDIGLGRPRKMTGFLQLNMPSRWRGNGWLYRLQASGVSFVDRSLVNGRTVTASQELVIDAWSLAAAELQAYNDIAKKLQQNLFILTGRQQFGRIRQWLNLKARFLLALRVIWYVVWGGWVLIFLISILFARR
jgi:transglutaminase-like putative cysteine protease